MPEIECRHISITDQSHPIKQVALDCLKDVDIEHPSALQLCKPSLKDPQYCESVKAKTSTEEGRSNERDKELRSLRQQHSQQVHYLITKSLNAKESDNYKRKLGCTDRKR